MKFCPTCGSKLLISNRENDSSSTLKVLKCETKMCHFQFYNNPTPVVGALVEHYNEKNEKNIVLVRGLGWPKDWFGLVTGFLEYNEDPKIAVVREIQEELGIKEENIKNLGLIGLYPFEKMNQLMIVYHCQIKGEIFIDKRELEAFKLGKQ
eukprot:gene7735-12205_t